MYKLLIKRFLDVIITSLGLVMLVIPILTIVLLLFIFNKGAGAFFYQIRTGKNARLFRIYKFKTMTDERDKDGSLLPDEQRMTIVGRYIRSASLDELPQLLNVLKGDMSLIGPRPLLEKYIPLYSKEQARRHEVRPGITGWAQVNGRNAISWEEKFEMDVWYVDHVSFILDIKILWKTFLKVLKREGISAEGSVSGVPFKGNDKI